MSEESLLFWFHFWGFKFQDRYGFPTIDRHIALLAKSNLIEHRDSDKTGGYYVKKNEG